MDHYIKTSCGENLKKLDSAALQAAKIRRSLIRFIVGQRKYIEIKSMQKLKYGTQVSKLQQCKQ